MGDAKITQTTVGVLREGDPDAKITQTTVGVLRSGDPDAKITQLTVGVLRRNPDILNATVKKVHWLFEVDKNNDGTVDYYWSKEAYTWLGHSYTFKITSFSPVTLVKGNPEINNLPASKMTIQITNPDNTLLPSDFEGGGVTVRLVLSATVGGIEQYWEIRTLGFTIQTATNVDQKMTLQCQDWLTAYLEGDYPNTPLVSDLFPADVMKDDNICVPVVFGTPYIPLRWVYPRITATYVDVDTFTVVGDQTTLFSAGQYLLADCGVDGTKSCKVSSSSFAAVTTVNLTAGSDDLTSNLDTVSIDQYLLGPDDKTYTISRARTPREVNFKSTYLSTDYTMKQGTVEGRDGEDYKAVQLLCHDADDDGTNDANGFWGITGKEVYDVPFRFSRSDLVSKTNPADIFAYLMEEFGIPSNRIDTDSIAAAAAVFTARSFALNIPLWYMMSRKKLISKLLTMSGMIPVIGQKIGLKVLTKSPMATLTESLVKPGSFQINKAFTSKQKDSGYVTWQDVGEPQDQTNKSIMAAKSSADNLADTVIECEWVNGSTYAQKAGKLALQRTLLRNRTLSFSAWSTLLFLYPGDMITIGEDNYGAEGSSYDALITKMTISEGLLIKVECDGFSDTLDDWNDIVTYEVVVEDANTNRGYSPVYQGPRDSVDQVDRPNAITQTVLIGANGELKTNDDPATNGGFIATNQAIRCYNDSGDLRFEVVYDGSAADGDVTIGDYAGGSGIKWDQSASTLAVKVNSTGGVTVAGGGDITLTGSDSDPGKVVFSGTSYNTEIGADAAGDEFLISPQTDGVIYGYIGADAHWGNRFYSLDLLTTSYAAMTAGTGSYGDENEASVFVSKQAVGNDPYVRVYLRKEGDPTPDLDRYVYFYPGSIKPSPTDVIDLGGTGNRFDSAYINSVVFSNHGWLQTWSYQSDSFADDATTALPDATAGWVDVSCNGEAGRWVIESDGTVTKVVGTANTAASDSDTDLCVYQSGTQAIVKNRLGLSGELRAVYFYN
jgi:hypothetical protein